MTACLHGHRKGLCYLLSLQQLYRVPTTSKFSICYKNCLVFFEKQTTSVLRCYVPPIFTSQPEPLQPFFLSSKQLSYKAGQSRKYCPLFYIRRNCLPAFTLPNRNDALSAISSQSSLNSPSVIRLFINTHTSSCIQYCGFSCKSYLQYLNNTDRNLKLLG